ncbi:hypothetical protein ACFLXD_01725 [Chloroflexota bacterium]
MDEVHLAKEVGSEMSDTATRTKKQDKQNVNKEKTLLVFHIPKTGGNTIQRLIERKFSKDAMFLFHGGLPEGFQKDVDLLERLSEEDKRRIRCIWGGPFCGIHKYLPQPSIYVALFRDPIERVISDYYWVLRRRTNAAHNEVVSKNMSLEDYVINGVWRAWNGQTRFIRRVPEVSPPGHGPVSLSNDDLEIAKANLRQNFVFGLIERFDESLILLKRTLGWRTKDIFYVKQNVARNRPAKDRIGSETVKLIEDHNELDIKLYEFVKQMFEERIARQGTSFNRELQTFRLLNTVFGPVMNIYDKVKIKVFTPLIALVRLLLALVKREVSASYVYNKVKDSLKSTR